MDNYILRGNVDQLDEAQVICLGESHGNKSHCRINANIINYFNLNRSILLTEKAKELESEDLSFQSEFEKACTEELIDIPIKIDGWDIQFDKQQMKDIEGFMRAGIIHKKPRPIHFINGSKLIKLKEDIENSQLSNCERTSSVFSFLCTMCCTGLFVKSCNPCISKYYEIKTHKGLQKIVDNVPVRNQSMCNSIQKASEIYERVFVVAGSGHFEVVRKGEGREGINYKPSNDAVKKTIKFLKTKKYVILIPKSDEDFSSSNDESKEEMKVPARENEDLL